MRSSWRNESGHLLCQWSGVGERVQYNPPWMQDVSAIQGSYLPPIPNFASHSPFAGVSWFERYPSKRKPA